MRCVLAAALLAGACDGSSGLVSVSLTTAPGSTVLDGVQTLRMEVTNPKQIVMAERTSGGFELAIEVPASGTVGAVIVDGFAADGALVATGKSPRFTLGGVDGAVVIYMAEPDSMGVAPVALASARSELGVGVLAYGAIFVGGQGAGGVASNAVEIYNVFDHTLLAGLPLPAPRSAPAVGVGVTGVYIFGGSDSAGLATATLYRFDTTVRPSGAYSEVGDKSGFARSGERFVLLGDDVFLLTGTPAAELMALGGTLAVRDDIASLPSAVVAVAASDGMATSIFAGTGGIVRFRGGQFDTLSAPGRADVVAVAVPDGKVAIVCGTTDALRIDAASGLAETFPAVPTVAKSGCAAAATTRHLLIAGGTTATGVDGSVEVYDAVTLAPLVTATLAVPRTGAVAIALANDQILIAGGVDAAGAPVATLELFTPASR